MLFLGKYGAFLSGKGEVHYKTLHKFNAATKGMKRSLGKKKTKDRVIRQARRRKSIITVNMGDLLKHENMEGAIHRLCTGTKTDTVNKDVRYLISKMVINSGARLGAVARMQISEVEGADDVAIGDKAYKVISVADHKTSLQGPFQIPVSKSEHQALLNICKRTRSKFPNAQYPFVTADGKRYSVSRLNYEFQGVWRETGMLKKSGKFNCTDNRKRIASVLGQGYPGMREQIAKQLKHSVAIEREIYDHAVAAENAVKIMQHLEALVKG